MAKRTCSVEGCDKTHYGKGLCQQHYGRVRRSREAIVPEGDGRLVHVLRGRTNHRRSTSDPEVTVCGQRVVGVVVGPPASNRLPCASCHGITKACAVEGCEKACQRGCRLCSMHYARQHRHGDVGSHEPVFMRVPGQTIAEKLQHFAVCPEHGCWRWGGQVQSNGYGRIWLNAESFAVHRVAYEHWVGPIPDGLVIDHVLTRGCSHKDCINPQHLEAVTQLENMRRVPWRSKKV